MKKTEVGSQKSEEEFLLTSDSRHPTFFVTFGTITLYIRIELQQAIQ